MKKFFSFVSSAKSLVAALLLGAGVLAAWADATLNTLEVKIKGENVVTGFSPATTDYNIDLPGSPAFATFSAVPASPDAIVDISLDGTQLSNHSYGRLSNGSQLKYTVSSGSETKVYTVTVKTPTPCLLYTSDAADE